MGPCLLSHPARGRGQRRLPLLLSGLAGGCPRYLRAYAFCPRSEISAELASPGDLSPCPPDAAGPTQFSVSGELDGGVQKACRTRSLLLPLLPRPPFPFELSLLQSITAAPESVVDEYMTKYHQDCYSVCAEPSPRAGLRVPGHCNVCCVCAPPPPPPRSPRLSGVFLFGFGLVFISPFVFQT